MNILRTAIQCGILDAEDHVACFLLRAALQHLRYSGDKTLDVGSTDTDCESMCKCVRRTVTNHTKGSLPRGMCGFAALKALLSAFCETTALIGDNYDCRGWERP